MIEPKNTVAAALPLPAVADLEMLQHKSFSYFLHETNPDNGLVIDKTAEDWPASIAATGLALECQSHLARNLNQPIPTSNRLFLKVFTIGRKPIPNWCTNTI